MSNKSVNTKLHENLSLKNLPNEKWKDIPNYEGIYQVSNFCRIKSLSRTVFRNPSDKASHYMQVTEKILKQHIAKGRYRITLSNRENVNVSQLSHVLMASAFLGYNYNSKNAVADHIDNNPLNNRLSNIQIITNRHNSSKDKKGYTSKYVGVNWNSKRKKWKSCIYINGKNKHLGFFDDEKEASEYYQNALKAINKGTEIKIKRRTESSKFNGVGRKGNKWSARITISKGKREFLGVFDTELEAHQAVAKGEEEFKLGKPITLYPKETSSKHKGIVWDKAKKKWKLTINGKYIGRYATEEEAIKVKNKRIR